MSLEDLSGNGFNNYEVPIKVSVGKGVKRRAGTHID
jgi:hypothetical protein